MPKLKHLETTISPLQKILLEDMFDSLDEKYTGRLNKSALNKFISDLQGPHATAKEHAVWNKLLTNRNGTYSFKKVLPFIHEWNLVRIKKRRVESVDKNKLQEIFEAWDSGDMKYLTRHDLSEYLQDMCNFEEEDDELLDEVVRLFEKYNHGYDILGKEDAMNFEDFTFMMQHEIYGVIFAKVE